tara:strand:- start:208 stop:1671 length:1464 start_codon:yes stop_codon:yes gene_type:complete
MSLLTLQNLGITLGDPLFSDLTMTLNKGDRLGLVAANGRGKTTLMQCMTGETEPTKGDITRARGLRVGHVAQYVPNAELDQTLYDLVLGALPAEQADFESWRVDVVLGDLSVPYDLQQTQLRKLSGGWQRTAMLAAAWITEPDVLLLDEPTNHLDLHRIGLLENWLRALPRDVAVIITSHDRAFLDAVCTRTLFLRAETSRDFALPFTPARDALDETDAADARRFANDLNKATQLRKQAAKLKNIGINSGSDLLITKTKQLTERAAKIEAGAKPAHREKGAGEIKLGNAGTHAKALVTFDNVAVQTPDGRALYNTGEKWITPGDRIVLLGANGTGKTQLVQMVHRALSGGESPVRAAPSVSLGYSDQHLSQLNKPTPRCRQPPDNSTSAINARAGYWRELGSTFRCKIHRCTNYRVGKKHGSRCWFCVCSIQTFTCWMNRQTIWTSKVKKRWKKNWRGTRQHVYWLAMTVASCAMSAIDFGGSIDSG